MPTEPGNQNQNASNQNKKASNQNKKASNQNEKASNQNEKERNETAGALYTLTPQPVTPTGFFVGDNSHQLLDFSLKVGYDSG